MDLYINREELLRGLRRSQGIVERHTTNLQLSHVLLSAQGDRLRLTASDSTLWLVADYPARIEAEGELGLDAQTFFQIINSLVDSTVHLQIESGNRMKVQCGKAVFHVLGLAADEFAPVPARDDRAVMQLPATSLRGMIEETLFSVSSDENRYGLNGAHLEEVTDDEGKPRLRFVTTDGSRLSWSEAPFEGEFGMGRRMLVPRKALDQVRRLCDEDELQWTLGFGERTASFSTTDLTFMVRLIDGEFPDYRQVMPSNSTRRMVLERGRFTQELRHVAIMASDRNHSARFAFEPDRLVITAHSVDSGDAQTEIAADLEGEPLFTGFNVVYFQEILKATKSDQIVLEMGEPLDPCVVRIPDRDDCVFVVMPMRLD